MKTAHRDRWNLFLCSFTILFVELICIRWIPAYVRAPPCSRVCLVSSP